MNLYSLNLTLGASKTIKQSFTIPQKDFGYDINFAVAYANAAAFNLANYNVNLKTWSPTNATPLVNKSCNVNTTTGNCNYSITSGDFNTTGIYYAELEATNSNTFVLSTETFKIIVAESG